MRYLILTLITLLLTPAVAMAHPKVERTVATVQNGPHPLDVFTMTRVAPKHGLIKGAILLLPPANGTFEQYELGTHSFVDVMIEKRFAVYGYTPPVAQLNAGDCESLAVDCSAAANWDLTFDTQAISWIRDQIPAQLPVVITGLSLGSVRAMAAVNDRPADYAGVVLWEGGLITSDPIVMANAAGLCAQEDFLIANGVTVEPQFFQFASMALASGPAATVGFFSSPNPNANGDPGFIVNLGDPSIPAFAHADLNRVAGMVNVGSAYESFAAFRDLHCHLAGLDTTHTANWGAFSGDIFVISSEFGFDDIVLESALASGTPSGKIVHWDFAGFGHADQYLSPFFRLYVAQPIGIWSKWVAFK